MYSIKRRCDLQNKFQVYLRYFISQMKYDQFSLPARPKRDLIRRYRLFRFCGLCVLFVYITLDILDKRFIEAKQKRERESYETRNERCIEEKQKRERERAL